jgi:DNA-binding transcriptional MerR regulator
VSVVKINEVAKLSGVSVRTLHYYDEIGLLSPSKDVNSNYRLYTEKDLDTLQQILFYRELQYPLMHIKEILKDESFDLIESLIRQKEQLLNKQSKLQQIVCLIDKTIKSKQGGFTMTNEEKFNALKQNLVEQNEENYGEEIRQQFGEETVLATYGKLKEMTEEQYEAVSQLELQLFERLNEGLEVQSPSEDLMLEIAELYKRWLNFYWVKYSESAHAGLAHMYLLDERFIQYYDSRVMQGATKLLVESIHLYTK